MAAVPEVMWLTNAKGDEVLYISPEYEEVWGHPCQSLYDTPNAWLEAVHPDEQAGALARMESAGRGEICCQQFRIVRPDGSVRLIQISYYPIKDISGRVCNTVTIAEDITDRRRREQQYFQTMKMDALGRLAGGVAHSFNNLLTVIMGYCDMMIAKLDADDPLRSSADQIRKAGEKASALNRQLQAFSRKQVLVPELLDLNAFIADKQPALLQLIGETIHFSFSPETELCKVAVDPAQLSQVITNIVTNAKEAMPRGGKLTIATANVKLDEAYATVNPDSAAGQYVLLAISDTGGGMDEATQELVFEPYFTTKGPDRDWGLGLATVYGVVKQSGGRIEIQSEQGAGTTFKIYFPRSKFGSSQRSDAASDSALRRGTETVLVLDDESPCLSMARTVLQSMGYSVLKAKNPGEAIFHCQKNKNAIHLLLIDPQAPKMGGPQLAAELTALRPEMKALYLAEAANGISAAGTALGAGLPTPPAETPCLEKPFTAVGLARRVREVLDKSPGRKSI